MFEVSRHDRETTTAELNLPLVMNDYIISEISRADVTVIADNYFELEAVKESLKICW